jgi:hypothetical protein
MLLKPHPSAGPEHDCLKDRVQTFNRSPTLDALASRRLMRSPAYHVPHVIVCQDRDYFGRDPGYAHSAHADDVVWVSEKRLFVRHESAHGPAMANHARFHSVEIIFYSAALFLVAAGTAWLFLR